MIRILVAALLLACGPALAKPRLLVRSGAQFPAIVVRGVDGDTLRVSVPAWAGTPFDPIDVRISGIDTPESRKPPAKCKAEVALGKAASAFAKTLVKPGDAVTLTVAGADKFFRLDGSIALPDGRDWATVMLGTGMARPYAGKTKPDWCRRPPPIPPARPANL